MDIAKVNINSAIYDLKDEAAREALANKVDKVSGKGLSANDYTTAEKNKLAALPTNATLSTRLAAKQETLPLRAGSGTASIESANGTPNEARGAMSFAIGQGNTAAGELSMLLGRDNTAYGYGNMEIGSNNYANADYACCFGKNGDAQGWASTALGYGCKTSNEGEVAIGKWNETKPDLVFSVGIGESNAERKNALVVRLDGSVVFPVEGYGTKEIGTAIAEAGKSVDGGYYDSESKTIKLMHGNDEVATIDAADFIKDGMVSNVEIKDGKIVITFNTDAGKESIALELTDIFDPSDYYNKAQVDLKSITRIDYTADAAILVGGIAPNTTPLANIKAATETDAGVMTAADRVKLDALPTAANLYTKTEVDTLMAGKQTQIDALSERLDGLVVIDEELV